MRRKIALISEHASPIAALGGIDFGGQNVYVAQVARNLAAMGWDVDVFTRKDNNSLPEIEEWENGVRIFHVPAGPQRHIPKEQMLPYMPEFAHYVQGIILRQPRPYDLIHANFFMSGMVAMEIKRKLNIPFVITFHALGRVRRKHQNKNDGFSDERFAIEEQIIAEADRIIAECPQDLEDLTALYAADPANISLAPCGFDPDEMWPVDKIAARKRLNLPVDERIILQLGRMVPRKGVDNAIRGLSRLVHHHNMPALLVIVGGDTDIPDPAATPEIARLQAIAHEEGVADRVIFAGRKARHVLRYYYSAADVFISTPWYEPFGITPVEAMACGTPVIGSNVGGIKYTIQDGKTGFLVTPDDPEALGDRLAQLYRSPEMLKRFRGQAIRRANQLFTWKKATDQLASVYEEVIGTALPEKTVYAAPLAVIEQNFHTAQDALEKSRQSLSEPILAAAQMMIESLTRGNKVLVCGNGGSAADALHFSSELIARFKAPTRPGLPFMALTADIATITAWANDVGYDGVFARQVEAFGQPGDVLFGISTSGNSSNLIQAFAYAQQRGIHCIGLIGGNGGELLPLSDVAILVPTQDKQRIQEIHLLVLHILSEIVENRFLVSEESVFSSKIHASSSWPLQSGAPIRVDYQQQNRMGGTYGVD